MDKYSGKKLIKGSRLVSAVLLSIASLMGITCVSAYYAARIEQPTEYAYVASLDFGLDGAGIIADLSELDEHLLAFKEGESFKVRFSTVYEGSIDCYVVPKLNVQAKNFSDGDIITVTDGNLAGALIGGKCDLYSEARLVHPGDTVEMEYTIRLASVNGEDPLVFSFDFSIAAMQASGNESLAGSADSEELYKDILDNYNGGDSPVNGFTDFAGIDETRELGVGDDGDADTGDGDSGSSSGNSGGSGDGGGTGGFGSGSGDGCDETGGGSGNESGGDSGSSDDNSSGSGSGGSENSGLSDRVSYAVRLEPGIEDGNTAMYTYTWYAIRPGADEEKLCSSPEAAVSLVLSNRLDGTRLRYEIKNEAGVTYSNVLIMSVRKDGVSYEETAYTA